MRHLRPILLTALLLGLAHSAAPAGAVGAVGVFAAEARPSPRESGVTDTVLATVLEPSAVRTYAGTEVYSAFSAGAYHLTILRGGVIRQLPVAPADAPFEVDVGPDGHGRPELIYSRCRAGGKACKLFLYSLAATPTPTAERAIPAADAAGVDDGAPTIWGNLIAFVRQAKAPSAFADIGEDVSGTDRAVVYTLRLDAPGARPEALPGVAPAAAARSARVEDLELFGRHLAEIVGSESAGEQNTQVVLTDLATRASRRLAREGVGEGGEYFSGIGFAAGRLLWGAEDLGPRAQIEPGIYRYRLSDGTLGLAPLPKGLAGNLVGLAPFAADGAYLTDAQSEFDGCGEAVDGSPRACQLLASQPLAFRPVPAQR